MKNSLFFRLDLAVPFLYSLKHSQVFHNFYKLGTEHRKIYSRLSPEILIFICDACSITTAKKSESEETKNWVMKRRLRQFNIYFFSNIYV